MSRTRNSRSPLRGGVHPPRFGRQGAAANARCHAAALVARLSSVELDEPVVIVVGAAETALAERSLRAGAIAAYVSYADTAAGVLVERHGTSDRVIALVDVAIECAAGDVGERTNDLQQGAQA